MSRVTLERSTTAKAMWTIDGNNIFHKQHQGENKNSEKDEWKYPVTFLSYRYITVEISRHISL